MKKTILITGGGRGIGAACARLAAAQGYRVCINYRSDGAAAASIVRAIEDAGGEAVALRADVARPSSARPANTSTTRPRKRRSMH
jgi:NAD(P)-dependent dehydrogenase (short-subunit alcohol dehydrogenase family)